MRRSIRCAFLCAFLVGLACGSPTTNTSGSDAGVGPDASETSSSTATTKKTAQEWDKKQQKLLCPQEPEKYGFKGEKGPGDPCSSWENCKAVCCGCFEGGKTWVAAACVNGRCPSEMDTCLVTEDNDKLCK